MRSDPSYPDDVRSYDHDPRSPFHVPRHPVVEDYKCLHCGEIFPEEEMEIIEGVWDEEEGICQGCAQDEDVRNDWGIDW
jgi:formylmethanofuran dehydrogenase subunit E